MSAGLLTDTDAYYDALTTYRNGDLNPIIEEFSRRPSNGSSSVRAGTPEPADYQIGICRAVCHLRCARVAVVVVKSYDAFGVATLRCRLVEG